MALELPGGVELKRGQPDSALKAFRQVEQLTKARAPLAVVIAQALPAKGDTLQAKEKLWRASALDPLYASAEAISSELKNRCSLGFRL